MPDSEFNNDAAKTEILSSKRDSANPERQEETNSPTILGEQESNKIPTVVDKIASHPVKNGNAHQPISASGKTHVMGQESMGKGKGVFQAGDVIAQKYKVLQLLGKGGMGAVYKVEHLLFSTQKFFALKVMHAELCGDASFRKRFIREVEIAMQFIHEHAVPIRDFGETEDNLQYFTMDFSEGISLHNLLQKEKFLEERRAFEIIRQILHALKNAHLKNIIHRDLKPDNILVETRDGKDHALVLDFGIAKIVSDNAQGEQGLTQAQVIGTPSYMSPEQATCDVVDPRTDLYAMGVILYELLTGSTPFKGSASEIITSHLSHAPPLARKIRPTVSAAAEAIVLKAMAKKKEDRFSSAQEMIDAIDKALLHTGGKKRLLRSPAVVIRAVLLLLIAAVSYTITFTYFRGVTRQEDKQAVEGTEKTVQEPKKIEANGSLTLYILNQEELQKSDKIQVASRNKQFIFTGRVKDDVPIAQITINGKEIVWNGTTGDFSTVLELRYGANDIALSIIDSAGKSLERKWTIARAYPSNPKQECIGYKGGIQRTGMYKTKAPSKIQGMKWRVPLPGVIYTSPIVTDEAVYFGVRCFDEKGEVSGKLFAIGLNAKTRWIFPTRYPVVSAPCISDGMIYFGTEDGCLYALEVETGTEVWNFKVKGSIEASPSTFQGVLYFVSADRCLHALDMKSGEEKWRFPTRGVIYASPAIVRDRIYFGSYDANMYAVELRTGLEKWKFQTGFMKAATPAVSENIGFFPSAVVVYALELETGKEMWRHETKTQAYSPTLTNDLVYICCGINLDALDQKTGKLKWSFKPTDGMNGMPVVIENTAFLLADEHIWAVDASTGEVKWKFKHYGVYTGIAIHDGVIYCGDREKSFYAFE